MIEPSARMRFAKIVMGDLDDYLSWYCNDAVMKYITGEGLSRQQALKKFEQTILDNERDEAFGMYTARLLVDGRFLGIVRFTRWGAGQAEVGYGLLPDYWGQGYAKEMLTHLILHAGSLEGLSELVAVVHPANEASVGLLVQHGFRWLETKNGVSHYHLALQA